MKGDVRSLVVLAARQHDDIGRRGLCSERALVRVVARSRALEELAEAGGDAAQIALGVRVDCAEQALPRLLGQVGLLEDALCGVDVGQVEGGAGVTGVEDGCEADAGLEGLDHDAVHFVVGDVAALAKVDGVDDLVVAVGLVAVEVLGLAAVARVVEEERVVGPGVLDEPVHGAQDVLLGGLGHGVLLIVCENNHVFAAVAKVLREVRCHVAHVVDAAAQLAALAKVVDADEQGLAAAGALRVLERVVGGGAGAELLRVLGRRLDGPCGGGGYPEQKR